MKIYSDMSRNTARLVVRQQISTSSQVSRYGIHMSRDVIKAIKNLS